MPETGTDGLDTLLFGCLVLLVGAVALVVFVRAVEARRHWSENRIFKRHFRENCLPARRARSCHRVRVSEAGQEDPQRAYHPDKEPGRVSRLCRGAGREGSRTHGRESLHAASGRIRLSRFNLILASIAKAYGQEAVLAFSFSGLGSTAHGHKSVPASCLGVLIHCRREYNKPRKQDVAGELSSSLAQTSQTS